MVEFVSSLGGGDGLRVEETLGSGYVRLRVAEAERRQAKHDIRCVEDAVIELLRNARDAGARRIFVASWRDGDMRSIVIVDDGMGIPPTMHERVFDARVTSKLDSIHMDRWGVHGRGMALYSIAQNAEDARVIESNVGLGTSIGVTFNTNDVGERADQSSWPTVVQTKGDYTVRGPRNIARACVEFALETKGTCAVYFGSASEVVATMHRRVDPTGAAPHSFDVEGLSNIPLCCRPGWAHDARDMRMAAQSLGLEMSERTAHRIVRSQIAPLKNVVITTTANLGSSPSAFKELSIERNLRLSEEDKQELVEEFEDVLSRVAARYYYQLDGKPKIRVEKNVIRLSAACREEE